MLDLFDCVAISTSDVELWLDNLPNFSAQTSSTRREQYAKYYDLARIISDAKLNGTFAVLEKQQADFLARPPIALYQTKYALTQAETDLINNAPCLLTRHECNIKSCPVRIKLARKRRNQRYYAKKHGHLKRLPASAKKLTNVADLK